MGVVGDVGLSWFAFTVLCRLVVRDEVVVVVTCVSGDLFASVRLCGWLVVMVT